jgi:hypothetical protein
MIHLLGEADAAPLRAMRLRAAGIEQVHLTVSMTAQQARRLYARAEFVRVATLEKAMKDGARYLDEDLMVLRP